MKEKCKKYFAVLIVIAIFISSITTVSAASIDSTIMPRWDVTSSCNMTFTITDPDTANVYVRYMADSSNFEEADLSVKLQKKILLFFWKTIDIGEDDNQWRASSTNANGYFYNNFTVDGAGTYRAVITLEIIGSDGKKDIIEETIEFLYE